MNKSILALLSLPALFSPFSIATPGASRLEAATELPIMQISGQAVFTKAESPYYVKGIDIKPGGGLISKPALCSNSGRAA